MSIPPELTVLHSHAAPREPPTSLPYTDRWIEDPSAYPVSLALPLAAEEYEGLPVRYWLRGLRPDNETRLQEIEREFAVSRDDPYAVLAHIGEDCVGAVQFARPERAEEIARGRARSDVEWLDEETLETLLREVAARSTPDRRAVQTGQFSLRARSARSRRFASRLGDAGDGRPGSGRAPTLLAASCEICSQQLI